MNDKHVVTTMRPWEHNIRLFNSYKEAKKYYDEHLGDRPTLAKVIEFNHSLFPVENCPLWVIEGVSLWKGTVNDYRDNWKRIFEVEFDSKNSIEDWHDVNGNLGYLMPNGRVLTYSTGSFAISVLKHK